MTAPTYQQDEAPSYQQDEAPSYQRDEEANRFPLSSAQEWWCSGDRGNSAGTFGPRFLMLIALRIAGRIDVAALQGALNDVVERHEILRTRVIRAAEPRYQQVQPPGPVRLEIRDLPPVTDRSRDVYAEEVILEANEGSMDVREVPLLRAKLERFDDRDAALIVITHHTASDGWSAQLILRDLAAFYTARTTGRAAELPAVRQYREFVAWERARVTGPAAGGAMEYWREKLRGARIFALPADRPVPEVHTRPYSAHSFAVDAEVMAATSALARAMRSSPFMVLLAAFNVLTHQITGTTDPVINSLSNGRSEDQFQHTVGRFLNVLPLRTDISECASFRDIVGRSRETCLGAYSHEMPIKHIEQEMPELMQPLNDPRMCATVVGLFQAQFDSMKMRIGDSSHEIRELRNMASASSEIPGGLAWTMNIAPSGELNGFVQYNPDEFDERTVEDWVAGYRRILSRAVGEPDREWKSLVRSCRSGCYPR